MTGNYDIALVVGTRPNFVKAAPLLNKLEEQNKKVLFIHTGQHFDKNMSKNIFDDLSIRVPDINLNAPSDSQRVNSFNTLSKNYKKFLKIARLIKSEFLVM